MYLCCWLRYFMIHFLQMFRLFYSLQFVNFYCRLMYTTCSWNALGINAMFFFTLGLFWNEIPRRNLWRKSAVGLDDWRRRLWWWLKCWKRMGECIRIYLSKQYRQIYCLHIQHYFVMRCAHHRHQIPRLRLWICFRYEPQLCNILQQCMSIYMHGSHSGQPSWFTMEIHRASSKLQICQMLVSTCRR